MNGQMKKTKTLPQLVKEADTWFSRYVRLRDSEYNGSAWVGECISCNRKMVIVNELGHWNPGANLGHFVGRSAKSVRWDEFNTNLQCAHCNAWRDKIDMLDAYKKGIDMKYGDGVWQDLVIKGKQLHKPTREELQEIIDSSKEYVKFSLANPSGYETSTGASV